MEGNYVVHQFRGWEEAYEDLRRSYVKLNAENAELKSVIKRLTKAHKAIRAAAERQRVALKKVS